MKKLYYKLSDNIELGDVVMTLEAALEWIKADEEEFTETETKTYTLEPIWMTDEEISNLPEAEL